MREQERGRLAQLAERRCVGAQIFAVFGGCWLLVSSTYARRFHAPELLGAGLGAAALVAVAGRLRRQALRSAGVSMEESAADQSDIRNFRIINAVTWVGVFLLFAVLPRLHLSNYVFPAFVALVGAHFLPMTGRFRHRANLVTGSVLLLWAAGCTAVLHGDGVRLAVWVTAGAGLVLWASAGWALKTASQWLQRM